MAFEIAFNPSGVIERAKTILNDYGARFFTEDKLWVWLLDGQREIALQVPEATSVTAPLELAPGVTQAIPATSHCLIDVPRNVTGEAIRPAARALFDEMRPGWATEEGALVIKHFIYDPERDKKTFEVWPPAAAGAAVECISSAMPDDSSMASNLFAVDSRHANGLTDYVVFRALNKLTGNPQFLTHAKNHFDLFMYSCGKSADAGLLLSQREAA